MMLRPKTWLAAARAAAGYSAPLLPFASFPAALTAEGQIRRPEELPHVSLIALGGIWRPLGGRQVLAQRHNNPVTRQDTSLGLIETIGTFPGGLVRAGMSISNEIWVDHSGISTTNRIAIWKLGGDTSQINIASSGTDLNTRIMGRLIAANDGAGPHKSLRGLVSTYPNAGNSFNNTIDFSAPWTTQINGQSANETAITITGATWSGGFATYTTNVAHNYAVADKTTVADISPSGWNGVFVMDAIPSSTQFRVPMAADPGAYVSGGTSSRISNLRILSYVMELCG
jgi:hypothetical protein